MTMETPLQLGSSLMKLLLVTLVINALLMISGGGVNGQNDTFYQLHGGACIPNVVWTQTSYILSNPDAWLYDINNYNGFGIHPDY